MSVLIQFINTRMSIKIPRKFFELGNLILKFIKKRKMPKVANTILEKITRLGLVAVCAVSDTKMPYNSIPNNIIHYRHKDRKTDK